MELLAAVQSLTTLKRFIEKDLLGHLASIQLSAAAATLANVSYANDKKSVYWSCINHLEDAEAIYMSKINTGERDEACRHYYYISALKATIYKYLGEERLMVKCCDDCIELERQRVNNDRGTIEAYNPRFMFSLLRTVLSKNELQIRARRFDSNEFWKTICDRKTNFSLPVYTAEKSNPEDFEWDSGF